MASQEQLEILKQGVEVWNKWRWKTVKVLDDGSVYKTDPRIADLVSAELQGQNLSGYDFGNANFSLANLSETNLSEANLRYTNLKKVNLNRAILIGADLRESCLTKASLVATDFDSAKMGNTSLNDIDFSESKGLEKIIHYEPSTLGIDTLFISKGQIPIEFLQGCGLSDLQIELSKLTRAGLDSEQITEFTYKIHQLYIGDGIQYYSCFISYNSKDEEFAKHLHDNLQDNGVRCWFALEDMKIGDQIRPTIDRQIRLRDKLLVILSENSVQSEWVGDEVEAALEEEKESGRLVLFPIRLDDAVMDTRDDWAAKVKRRRRIGDFSNWKDEGSYQKAFERLLRDLKAENV